MKWGDSKLEVRHAQWETRTQTVASILEDHQEHWETPTLMVASILEDHLEQWETPPQQAASGALDDSLGQEHAAFEGPIFQESGDLASRGTAQMHPEAPARNAFKAILTWDVGDEVVGP